MKARIAFVILANVAGNLLLSLGVKREWWLVLVAGVAVLTVWALARLSLLSAADLSYVLPITATGYVLNALAGQLFLGEQVSNSRWAGTLLIVAGSALVARTAPRST